MERDLAPGASFASDFEIVRALRSGGMGSVYVARQLSTGKQRALKLMLPQLVADAELRRRFDQEARIASLIQSDHVVEVVGAGVDEKTGVPWLAMELLDGSDLDAEIEAHGPMPLATAWRVMKELCHAVGAAHGAGIIHRDLKPENVFLANAKSAEETKVVKVLDFGIAKIAAEATSKNTAALGSPIWMAPEQTERGQVTPAADVWAIGLIGFFLLTGKCFWLSASSADGTVQQIMREVLFNPIPAASQRARQYGAENLLPPWFDAWFGRCVTRDASARFAKASNAFAAFDRSCGTGEIVDPLATQATPHVESLGPSAESSQRIVVTPPSYPGSHGFTPVSAEAASSPTAPTLYAGMNPPFARATAAESTGPRVASSPRWVRPGFLIAAIAVLGGSAVTVKVLHDRTEPISDPQNQDPTHHATDAVLPHDLAVTHGAAWFERNRSRCNPVQVELVVKQDPPSSEPDGVGFMAACFTLAGKLDRARAAIDKLPKDERPTAAWAVFEVVHPIADAGDDASAGPAMRLVLEYWPENYMALYHAGMSEYQTREAKLASQHLRHFLALYKKPDGFTASAQKVLAELDVGANASPDCATPLSVDPEGRKIFRAGCQR